jgi:DNA replication protein DnaC
MNPGYLMQHLKRNKLNEKKKKKQKKKKLHILYASFYSSKASTQFFKSNLSPSSLLASFLPSPP